MSSPRPLHILLVDDEPDLREALAQMLVFMGHEVSCAENGEEALQVFHGARPTDVLITDLSMPGMGGSVLISTVRALNKHLPIIVFSGLDETMAHSMIKSVSDVRFLKKPFTFQTMANAINESLAKSV